MYRLQDYKILDIENSLISWINTSFFITSLVPLFFTLSKNSSKGKILFFIILIILSCAIIIIAVVPFYFRHNVVIHNIKTNENPDDPNKNYQKLEKRIFLGEMIFFVIYFLLNIGILIYMIRTYIKSN